MLKNEPLIKMYSEVNKQDSFSEPMPNRGMECLREGYGSY